MKPTAETERRAFPPIAAVATITIIVPAAGRGARTGLETNKILAPLHEKPLLSWTLRALLCRESLPQNVVCREVFIVARREEWQEIEARVLAPLRNELSLLRDKVARGEVSRDEVARGEYSQPILRLVEGGASRQSSVLSGVLAAAGDLVCVHDAARPLMQPSLCAKVIEAARECGAAIAAEAARDTVKIACADSLNDSRVLAMPFIQKTLERSTVFLAQTPQVFRREVLLRALQDAARDNFEGTDCASLVERLEDAPRVSLICDGSFNLKVTRREDFAIAELFLEN